MTRPRRSALLIHGSWMGGWYWNALGQRLARAGFEVFAPDLLGLGENPTVGLAAHVAQIESVLASIGTANITLIGHSYGAVVASEVAAAGSRVAQLVILDGFLLEPGSSIFDRYPSVEAILQPLMRDGPPGFIEPPPRPVLEAPGEHLPQAAMDRLRPMPAASHLEPARFDPARIENDVHYVRFSRFPAFRDTQSEARRLGWAVSELDVGHMAPLIDPDLVCHTILEKT